MASFLQFVSRGGPTAAASMRAVFKWYEANGGSQFRTGHPVIANFRFHRAGHTSRQAPELEPWEMVNLLLLLHRAKGTHKIIVALIVMSACSCIRWEHIQRSTLVTNHKDWLEMKCAQGRTRRNGARPAYHWACPNISWRGMQLQKILGDFWQFETLADKGFLVPAVELNAEDLWELAENTALVLDRAMSRSRFLELFGGALLECGVDKTTACGAASQISDHEAQAIGNWVEMPQGGGRWRTWVCATLASCFSGRNSNLNALSMQKASCPMLPGPGRDSSPFTCSTLGRTMSMNRLQSPHQLLRRPNPVRPWQMRLYDEEMPSDESSLSGSEKSAEGTTSWAS